jgi:hypothetical protein
MAFPHILLDAVSLGQVLVSLKESANQERKSCEDEVIAGDVPIVMDSAAARGTEEVVEELAQGD